MIVIVGGLVVIISVLVGFTMAGGKVGALIHLSEFITIGGAALGAMIISSPMKVIKDLVKGVMQTIKGSPYNKQSFTELLKLFFQFAKLIRQDGLLALDSHVGQPSQSTIFKQAPKILGNHHATHFICDGLALIMDGKADAAQLKSAMDEETEVIHREHHAAVGALAKTADALPGFGIVAAVLGIVVTMGAIGGPVEEIGYKVGAALVGTFLGILMAYGFFAPMAARMESLGEQEMIFLNTITSGILAMSEGLGPRDVVTKARRIIGTDCRPSQAELKQIFSDN